MLILASASPRRRELLDMLGLTYEIRAVDVDESVLEGETPEELVVRLARDKASAKVRPDELVLAADTIVVLDDMILGKPTDPDDAVRMLSRLQGRAHVVLTGVALLDGASRSMNCRFDRTEVSLGVLDASRIDWYVGTGEPLDKAGSYAIQGLGSSFVEAIQGNYTNVVGLPLPLVRALLQELGHDLFDFCAPS